MKEFPGRLKELREAAGLRQSDVGKMLGVHGTTVGTWEQGRREPTPLMLANLARIFDVPADYLLGDDEAAQSALSVHVHPEVAMMFEEADWRRIPPHERQIIEGVVKAIIDKYGKRGVSS